MTGIGFAAGPHQTGSLENLRVLRDGRPLALQRARCAGCGPTAPSFSMSGYTGAQLRERAHAPGVSDVLRKPRERRDIAEPLVCVPRFARETPGFICNRRRAT